jgi:hypothetical protein
MSLVFREAFVDPSGLPRGRFAGGALLLRGLFGLGILLFLTSIHGSCHGSSGQSAAGVGSSKLTGVNLGPLCPLLLAEHGEEVR